MVKEMGEMSNSNLEVKLIGKLDMAAEVVETDAIFVDVMSF